VKRVRGVGTRTENTPHLQRMAARTCSSIFRLFRRPATLTWLRAPGSATSWLLAAPASCPPRTYASGDARASPRQKPNHLMIRDGCGIRPPGGQSHSEPCGVTPAWLWLLARAGSRWRPFRFRSGMIRNLHPGRGDSMGGFRFEPIKVNSIAPGGERVVRTFDDITAFADALDTARRQSIRWQAVSANVPQARFGARRAEVHQAMRDALAAEGWLAD
jgi:hypothetical protein